MAKTQRHKELLEDEWYHVRHSGELPEIVLQSSIFFLTEDSEGPELILQDEDLRLLRDAASKRYLEIILRDITPGNRDTTIYRGIIRTISNWRRFKRFCGRHQMQADTIDEEVVKQFISFLENEIKDVQSGKRQSCINCTFDDIASFAVEMGISLNHIENDLQPICLNFC